MRTSISARSLRQSSMQCLQRLLRPKRLSGWAGGGRHGAAAGQPGGGAQAAAGVLAGIPPARTNARKEPGAPGPHSRSARCLAPRTLLDRCREATAAAAWCTRLLRVALPSLPVSNARVVRIVKIHIKTARSLMGLLHMWSQRLTCGCTSAATSR